MRIKFFVLAAFLILFGSCSGAGSTNSFPVEKINELIEGDVWRIYEADFSISEPSYLVVVKPEKINNNFCFTKMFSVYLDEELGRSKAVYLQYDIDFLSSSYYSVLGDGGCEGLDFKKDFIHVKAQLNTNVVRDIIDTTYSSGIYRKKLSSFMDLKVSKIDIRYSELNHDFDYVVTLSSLSKGSSFMVWFEELKNTQKNGHTSD